MPFTLEKACLSPTHFFSILLDMLLDVTNLTAGLEDGKEILRDLNIQIGQGEIHALMGPNGAGKSSLGNTLMGNPVYKITGGKILFKDVHILLENKNTISALPC